MFELLHFEGLIIAISSFFIIGVFHPIVIKAEYYFGTRIWPVFAIFGTVILGIDLFIQNAILQAIFGVLGCTFFWSIYELFHQKKRVERGGFPNAPRQRRCWSMPRMNEDLLNFRINMTIRAKNVV